MRLLCVFAHPDDESYGPGGTIARYAMEGVEVSILMFTCGEAGTIGVSKQTPRERLSSLRTDEMAAACEALGVADFRMVGAPDRGMDCVDEQWAVEQIERDIRKYRPHVLMTFHHLGVSGHSDHIAVARFLELAFDRVSSDPEAPKKIWGWGIPREKFRLYERPNLIPLENEEVNAVIDIPDAAMDRKVAAIAAHQTQHDFFLSLQERFDYREVSRPEFFHLRKTRLPRPEGVEDDLFGGIE
jgi:LmbE family N-acetylglucosaminyl deacetylase